MSSSLISLLKKNRDERIGRLVYLVILITFKNGMVVNFAEMHLPR